MKTLDYRHRCFNCGRNSLVRYELTSLGCENLGCRSLFTIVEACQDVMEMPVQRGITPPGHLLPASPETLQ